MRLPVMLEEEQRALRCARVGRDMRADPSDLPDGAVYRAIHWALTNGEEAVIEELNQIRTLERPEKLKALRAVRRWLMAGWRARDWWWG